MKGFEGDKLVYQIKHTFMKHGDIAMNLKKLVGLRLTGDEHKRLKETSARLGCSQSELMRAALELAGTSDLTEELFIRAIAQARQKTKPLIFAR